MEVSDKNLQDHKKTIGNRNTNKEIIIVSGSHFYPGDLSHGNVFVHLDDLYDAIIKAVDN